MYRILSIQKNSCSCKINFFNFMNKIKKKNTKPLVPKNYNLVSTQITVTNTDVLFFILTKFKTGYKR